MSTRIVTVTLNPAIDISVEVDRIIAGPKLRCESPRYEPGGGGVNVARVLRELGENPTAFVVVGGGTGRWLAEMVVHDGIETIALDVGVTTRSSFHVHERASGDLFRFVLPGEALPPSAVERVVGELANIIERTQTGYLVLSGSLPPGLPETFLARIAACCNANGVHLAVDSLPAALFHLMGSRAFLVKPNEEEFEELRLSLGWPARPLIETARDLVGRGIAEIVVVTLGANGALLVSADAELQLPAPELKVVSPVGAGDSFLAGFVYGLANGQSLSDAFRLATAAGAAAVLTPGSGLARKSDIERILGDLP